MEISVVGKAKNHVGLLVKGTTPAYINALRRIFMNKVPTLAIEKVHIKKNNTAVYDEILAHRLGLIPLKTDLGTYKVAAKGEELSAQNQVVLTLKAKGPKVVYASELKSKDPMVTAVYPDMPILKLLKNQEVELEATAVMGRGEEHVKWSPCHIWYSFEPVVTVNNKSPEFAEFKAKYPKGAFDSSGKLDEKAIVQKGLVDACDGVCENVVKVTYNPQNIIFYIEPWGQLSVKDIVSKGLEIFNESIDDLENQVTAL